MYFAREEVEQLIVSWLIISIAFSSSALFSGRKELFILIFPAVLFGVGTGFILHELAHKFVAIRFGAMAHYRAWEMGLMFALLMAFITRGRFVFAAPGAVYIYSWSLSRKENGIISLAGPSTNFALAVLFFTIALLLPIPYIQAVLGYGAWVNLFLGFFNMLPIPPLDGSKVFAWNPVYWFAFFIIFLLSSFLIGMPVI